MDFLMELLRIINRNSSSSLQEKWIFDFFFIKQDMSRQKNKKVKEIMKIMETDEEDSSTFLGSNPKPLQFLRVATGRVTKNHKQNIEQEKMCSKEKIPSS